MGVESASFVQDLNSTLPAVTDKRHQGDDHMRLIKATLKATLPGGTRALYHDMAEVTVAADTTTDILGAAGDKVLVDGAATITSFGTGANRVKFVRFNGICTLTHNASTLILPGGTDITTAAGATMIVIGDASSNARVLAYQTSGGGAITGNLEDFQALTGAADKIAYFTGASAMAVTDFTSLARTLLALTTAANWRTQLGLVLGTDVQAYDADTMKSDVTKNLTVGYTRTSYNAGTKSSGTFTPDPQLGNGQYYTNNGAHTLAAPSTDCDLVILVTNGASAGTVTFSGFSGGNSGDTMATTNTYKYMIFISRVNGVSTYQIKACQ